MVVIRNFSRYSTRNRYYCFLAGLTHEIPIDKIRNYGDFREIREFNRIIHSELMKGKIRSKRREHYRAYNLGWAFSSMVIPVTKGVVSISAISGLVA